MGRAQNKQSATMSAGSFDAVLGARRGLAPGTVRPAEPNPDRHPNHLLRQLSQLTSFSKQFVELVEDAVDALRNPETNVSQEQYESLRYGLAETLLLQAQERYFDTSFGDAIAKVTADHTEINKSFAATMDNRLSAHFRACQPNYQGTAVAADVEAFSREPLNKMVEDAYVFATAETLAPPLAQSPFTALLQFMSAPELRSLRKEIEGPFSRKRTEELLDANGWRAAFHASGNEKFKPFREVLHDTLRELNRTSRA